MPRGEDERRVISMKKTNDWGASPNWAATWRGGRNHGWGHRMTRPNWLTRSSQRRKFMRATISSVG